MQYHHIRVRGVAGTALLLAAGVSAAVSLTGAALAKESVLYSFQNTPDGWQPWGALVADKQGDLFGATNFGGTGNCDNGCGAVFELSPRGRGAWRETVLYSFQGGSDGENPESALVMDAAGDLYGVTKQGGDGDCTNQNLAGCGVVFELSPGKNGAWREFVLYSFQGVATGKSQGDAAWPNAIAFGPSGELLGAASSGGTCPPPGDLCDGAYFELTKHRGAWREKVIYRADETTDGPSGVLSDANGNIYSVATFGGPDQVGEVFMLTPSGKGEWSKSVIYDFQNEDDGALPVPGLAFDNAGDLFGASTGTDSVNGNVYELIPGGNGAWSESVVASFDGANNGYDPSAAPMLDANGNLFGVTQSGGKNGEGVAYEISPKNGGWTESVLHSFAGGGDGAEPLGGVVIGEGGALYGVTVGGGAENGGTVFRVAP